MTYTYAAEREKIFSDDGQKMFLSIRDRTHRLIGIAGAVSLGRAIAGESGDSFTMIACVDRLVELKEIQEVQIAHPVWGQDRLFVKSE